MSTCSDSLEASSAVLQGKRILVVEDTVDNLRLFSVLLSMEGATVFEATDALTGIEVAHREIPDLILMDVHMPGMDGLEATRILRADAKTARIPIYAITASIMPHELNEVQDSGCNGHFTKPVDPIAFAHQIAAHFAAPAGA